MAINPVQPYFSLPPVQPGRAKEVAQTHFVLPGETGQKGLSMEDATRNFGESIQALSPQDRKEIQVIHLAVDQWAEGRQNADKLGQFLVRVMMYADQRLDGLESGLSSPNPEECTRLQAVFSHGFQLVEAYSALGRR